MCTMFKENICVFMEVPSYCASLSLSNPAIDVYSCNMSAHACAATADGVYLQVCSLSLVATYYICDRPRQNQPYCAGDHF